MAPPTKHFACKNEMEEIGLPTESASMEVDSILHKKEEKEEGKRDVSYERMKELQRELEFIDIQVPQSFLDLFLFKKKGDPAFLLSNVQLQETYIKDEQKNLKRELLRAQEEVKRIQSVPLVIGQFLEMVDENTGIIGSTTGSNYYVRILR